MNLDFAQLTAFAAVVDSGSFEAAAKRLHVTPSAVSQRIKALESAMGQVLVRRTRPVEATQAGQVLVRLAGQIALLEGEALAALDTATRSPRMPIAVNADSLATWFLPALAALPDGTIFDIRQEDQDHSAELLRNGSVMAAVTSDARPVQGCSSEPLGAMRYLAVASPHFVGRHFDRGVGAGSLATAPMLIFNHKDRLQDRFVEQVAGARLDPPLTFLPSSVAFVEAARLGLAWGMAPQEMAAAELAAGRLVELVPGRHVDVPLYWQRWRLDSATLGTLTDAVRATAADALSPAPHTR